MLGAVVLFLWLFVIPTVVGIIPAAGVIRYKRNYIFRWISGQILLWALFQFISVPVILLSSKLEHRLDVWNRTQFWLLQVIYLTVVAVILLAVLGYWFWVGRKQNPSVRKWNRNDHEQGVWHKILWIVFWLLLLFQLVQSVFMTYADGDDAFYVAVSTIAEESGTMYQKLPYTGGATGLDVRHGLAPFPIWIALLAKMSHIPSVTVAHVAIPLSLIPMTYGIYYLIGSGICGEKKETMPLFLIFTELLVLFGDYSIYTVENFMIARSRQGKAALGSIVIPMAVFLFLVILERLQENHKIELTWWILLISLVMTGCLCSTLGAVLLCMITGVVGICSAVCYRKWKLLLPMAISCVPAVCYALVYLLAEQ